MRLAAAIRIYFAILLCGLFAPPLLSQTSESMRVELSDGSTVEGRLQSIGGASVTLTVDGEEQTLALDGVTLIRSNPPSAENASATQVFLVDGSVLRCQSLAAKDGKLALQMIDESTSSIATRLVDFVQFLGSDVKPDADWQTLIADERESDALVVRRDKKLQMVDGVIGTITDLAVSFTAGERTADVKRERLAGLLFYRRYSEEAIPPKFVVELTDGSAIRATSLSIDQQRAAVVSMCGAELSFTTDAIATINFREGRSVWLTDLEPASNTWTPLLAGSAVLEKLKEFSVSRFDRNFSGRPLEVLALNETAGTLARKEYSRGFAIKGGGKLSYIVGKQYKKLTGLIGFDPNANSAGVVKLIVQVDGVNRIEKVLKASEMERPLPIEIDLSDASRIVFEVEYHDRRGVGDILHAVDMKLER